MIARMLIDGRMRGQVSALDRGLGYGDGLFETIRFVGADAPLWARHMQRLEEGCRRLGLPMPGPAMLLDEARAVSRDMSGAVVRVTLTRGEGARGYKPPAQPQPTRIVAAFDPPPPDDAAQADGIRVRLCATSLAAQPLLAGLKHLNRLEQVLARAEWDDPAITEGLLCDADGLAISATSANLFAVSGKMLATPAVDRCGVAGVGRAEVLAAWPHAQVRSIPLEELRRADELFLSSSVRGILPVRELDARAFAVGPVARALQAHWRELGF
ncbi:aminodeoxychorismate lyase [Frateuria sp. STR12]|uniref:aminodeoxychorismate lyase n=1 Tax=Frateuria hangzhouensis TaxID=2995589 RepID=UPI00226081E1|nr:aminodeoxychorismate lyase [Frateuria sp. STR12]MCX7512462.1 aminodeoxychorismate lyase [Frateuria sp. STR12]